MKQYLLLTSALVLLSGAAKAACIQTPTCSSLGYSSTSSCEGGTKCPWGNYWNCDAINKINSLNSQITNLTNKITEQTNKITNLETQITEIRKEVTTSNCLVGDILYSDMTCNSNYVVSKTPIGVVFDRSGKAIGLDESQKSWSTDYFDVPGVENITSSTLARTDLDGKKNTSTVLAYCKANGKSCPAFEYVNSYKTEGTKAGDWYLPSMGELYAIYDNMGVLNVALGKIAATRLPTGYHWSSSEYSYDDAWGLRFSDGYVDGNDKHYNNYYGRPVINFGEQDEEDTSLSCKVSDFYYSDNTCSFELDTSKTPIGIVIYADKETLSGQIMALDNSDVIFENPTQGGAASGNLISDIDKAKVDYNSCKNTNALEQSSDIVKDVKSYYTAGTKAGDWCIASSGILQEFANVRTEILNQLAKLNKSLTLNDFLSSTYIKNIKPCSTYDYTSCSTAWGLYSGRTEIHTVGTTPLRYLRVKEYQQQ